MPSKRLRVLLNFTHDTDHVVQETAGAVVVGLNGNDKFPTPRPMPNTVASTIATPLRMASKVLAKASSKLLWAWKPSFFFVFLSLST